MRKLLLVTGDIAAGKSTFADMLSKRYSASVFHKDSLKELLADTIGFADREENKKLSNAAVELLGFIFNEFARSGNELILEANFSSMSMESIHRSAKMHGYEMLTLVLEGDAEVLHARYVNRMLHEARHSAHLTTEAYKLDVFKGFIELGRKQMTFGNVIRINADDFSYQTDTVLLDRIDGFMRSL